MTYELRIISTVNFGNGTIVDQCIPAEPTGKWRIITKDGDATLYLEVKFNRKREEPTGMRQGLFRTPIFKWVDVEITDYIPEGCLSLIVQYDNKCSRDEGEVR